MEDPNTQVRISTEPYDGDINIIFSKEEAKKWLTRLIPDENYEMTFYINN